MSNCTMKFLKKIFLGERYLVFSTFQNSLDQFLSLILLVEISFCIFIVFYLSDHQYKVLFPAHMEKTQ